MKKRLKILYIHHGWGIGGAPLSLLYLIKNLNKEIYQPIVLFTHKSEASDLFILEKIDVLFETRYNRYFKHHVKGHFKFYQFFPLIKAVFHWFKIARKIAPAIYNQVKPDIIHLNSDVLTAWAYGSVGMGIPLICHNRDPIAKGVFGVRRFIVKKLLERSAKKIISISIDNKIRLGLDKITEVIYNPVPDEFFNTGHYKIARLKKVLFVGGIHKSKGLNLLLSAMKYVDHNVSFTLTGYYPKNNFLNKLKHYFFFKIINKNKNRIQIKGILSQQEMIKEMNTSSILVFPCIHSHFPRPVIEAYATKTPVIVSNLEGMNEIVLEAKTGWLVKPEPKAIAHKINEAVASASVLEKMGTEAQEFARNNFQAPIIAKKVEAVYQKILNL